MYPTFLSYYYKHFEYDVKPEVEERNENCIKTIINLNKNFQMKFLKKLFVSIQNIVGTKNM